MIIRITEIIFMSMVVTTYNLCFHVYVVCVCGRRNRNAFVAKGYKYKYKA